MIQQTADQETTTPSKGSSTSTVQMLFSGRLGVAVEAPRILHKSPVTIGRDPGTSTICLADDDRVSRIHARMQDRENSNRWQITDSGSRHGVFVNGDRIAEHSLSDGDVIRIGNSFLLFRLTPATSGDSLPRLPASTGLLGSSPAICNLRHTIAQLGPTESSVLLLGESGTGKELTAKALHQLSSRAQGRFVPVNCSTIPESLAESLLFGHEKGAFTSADRPHEGYFRAAHHGTLFLDEVAELPRAIQPKLLRALEERRVHPIGATRPIDADVRLIAATNRNIIEDINKGDFRGDLFFRLADLTIRMPPLRERKEDVLPILMAQWKSGTPRFAPDLIEALLLHRWPFNVRELLTIARELQAKGTPGVELTHALVVERLTMGEQLLATPNETARHDEPASVPAAASQIPSREELLELLRKHKGNISAIAREKNRSRMQVDRWLKTRALDKERY